MKRNVILLGVLLCMAATYTVVSDRILPDGNKSNIVEEENTSIAAPDFTVTDLTGKKHTLSDYRGKVVVLNFWASWCAPCVQEFPQMLDLAAKLQGTTVFMFLSIDENEDGIKGFLKKYAKNLPRPNVIVALDTDKRISQDLFQTYKIPETYLIKPDGTIQEKIIGFTDPWNSPAMEEKIRGL